MSLISAAATSAREAARSTDGKFGSYTSAESPSIELDADQRHSPLEGAFARMGQAEDDEIEAVNRRAEAAVDAAVLTLTRKFPDAAALTAEDTGEGNVAWTMTGADGSTTDLEDVFYECEDADFEDDLNEIRRSLPMDRPGALAPHARGYVPLTPATSRSHRGEMDVDRYTGTVDSITFDVPQVMARAARAHATKKEAAHGRAGQDRHDQ